MKSAPSLVDTRPGSAIPQICPVQTTPFKLSLKLKIRCWALIQKTLFRFSPSALRGFRRWLLRRFGAQLADTASIHNTSRIDCPWNLEMGDRASIGEEAWVYALDKIVIGDFACVGQRTSLLTGTHDVSDPSFPLVTQPIVIGYGSWIAMGAIILPGVEIGSLCIVGAGSVVTRDLPEQTICGGNPCRPIRRREMKETGS